MVTITPDIKELLEKAIIAFTTVSANGVPNTIAVACCRVISDNQVLITDNFFNKSRKNLQDSYHVSMAFWNLDNNLDGVGYQFKGTAEVFTTGEYKEMVDKMECNQGLSHKAAIMVTITEIWDLANPKLLSHI